MSRAARRQSRLKFTPLPSSSPASATLDPHVRSRAAAVHYDGASSTSKRRKITDYASSNARGHLPTPAPSSRIEHDAVSLDSRTDDSSDEELPQASSKRHSTSKRGAANGLLNQSSPLSKLGSTPSSATHFFGGARQTMKSSSRTTRAQQALDDESDEDILRSPKPHTATNNLVDFGSNGESDTSDLPVTPARKRLRSKRDLAISISSAESNSQDELMTRRSTRKRKTRALSPGEEEVDSESSESPVQASSKSRRNVSAVEQQELADDLMDLQSSEDEVKRPARKPLVKSQRQQALDALKARRAKMTQSDPALSPVLIDESDSDLEVLSIDEEEDSLPPTSSAKDMFNEDEDDEGFITDAEEGTADSPVGLPLAFTSFASEKPKRLFHFAVEWMVQKKLNPGFNDGDEVYEQTFRKLDDEVRGLAGSKFESSVWRPQFTFALRARPELASIRTGATLGRDMCDACGRSNHVPTFEVQFHGKPYHIETLEDVDDEDDEDEDDEDEDEIRPAHDSSGREIVHQDHTFYVGKFCMANAETAHALWHWRHHLYEWVVEYLENSGYNTPEQIVQRDRWGEPKRRKYANKVVDEMQENGQVKQLYMEYRAQIDRARDVKQPRWNSSP